MVKIYTIDMLTEQRTYGCFVKSAYNCSSYTSLMLGCTSFLNKYCFLRYACVSIISIISNISCLKLVSVYRKNSNIINIWCKN